MPDLDFTVTGVQHAEHGLTPLLHFKLGITNTPAEETIQSVILMAQIQIQAPGRSSPGRRQSRFSSSRSSSDRSGRGLTC